MTATTLPASQMTWMTDPQYAAPVEPQLWDSLSERITSTVKPPATMPTGADLSFLGYLGRGGPCARLDLLVQATPMIMGSWVVGLTATLERVTPPYVMVVAHRPLAEARPEVVLPAPPEPAPLTADVQIEAIQEHLSLQMSQIAQILDVTRKTAYGYRNRTVLVPKDGNTAARLRALHRLAVEWSHLASVPLGRMWSLRIDEDTPSLIEQLLTPEWDEDRLRDTTQTLAAYANERAERQRVMRQRGFGRGRDTGPEDRELRRLDDALLRIR